MKAVILKKVGEPLEVSEVDVPKPGYGEVLVKIVRTGVCYRDVLTVDGFFPRVKTPLVLGHEIAGVVVDKGDGVEEVDVGDRIASLPYVPCGECEYCRSGRENICRNRKWYGEVLNGSYSEYMLLDKRSIVKLERDIDWNYVAISSCVLGMVVHAIMDFGGIREGDKVLVTGASGGVGIHAVQLAKYFGGEVIAITRKEEKASFIEEAKPDHIIIAKGDFSKEVKKLTGGVDLVLETVGEPTFNYSLRSLKWGGRMAVIGNVNVKAPQLPLGLLILRENLVHGVISSTKKSLEKALEIGYEGRVKAIGSEMSLWDVEDAHDILRRGEARGRIFLKP